jgi:hypothetical protein
VVLREEVAGLRAEVTRLSSHVGGVHGGT